jgi:CheY-like chemotaxis protein
VENIVSTFRSGSDAFMRPRVLIVADSEERLCNLRSLLHASNPEITCAKTSEELRCVCCEQHDIAIVDLSSSQLQDTLGMIRANADHAMIPLLVAFDRLIKERGLDGVLPKYRAMPCSASEMATLVNSRTGSESDVRAASLIL